MVKRTVVKCGCGRVSNPIHLSIVEDTWVKNKERYIQFECPQCRKVHTIVTIWDESFS